MSQPNAPHPPTAAPPTTPAPRDRTWLVRGLIVATVLLFVATEGLLYYRWVTIREPACVLILDFAPALRDAEIEVTGQWSPEPLKATVGKGERFGIPFYLDPGRYKIRVIHHGQDVFIGELSMTRQQPGKQMDLKGLAPAAPASPEASPESPPTTASSLSDSLPEPAPALPLLDAASRPPSAFAP